MTNIVKIGGSCLTHGLHGVVEAVTRVMNEGPVVMVHGYGNELRSLLKKYNISREKFVSLSGIESHFTNELCASASVFASNLCRELIVEQFVARGHEVYAKAAFCQNFAKGKRKRKLRYLDKDGTMRSRTDDFSGTVETLDLSCLPIDEEQLILLSPIMADENMNLLVVDADKLAIEIALAFKSTNLILLSDVPGLRVDGQYVDKVNFENLSDLIQNTGGGMQRKLRHIQHALQKGVSTISILDATNKNSSKNQGTTFYA